MIAILMIGVMVGNLRNISLSTIVSLLLPTDEHAKANGKVGMVQGLSFGLTSVISGLMI